MENFLYDVRYALRGLKRSPGFAAAAIATLALGMGATTAIFSVIRAVVLAPLPYAQPERRVMIWSRWKDFRQDLAGDRRSRRLPAARSELPKRRGVELRSGEPDRRRRACADRHCGRHRRHLRDAGLGLPPWPYVHSRGKTARAGLPWPSSDGVSGKTATAADPGVIGRSIELDGAARRVVGVMPRGFALPTDFTADAAEPSQLYLPAQLDPKSTDHGSHGFYGAATLAPGRPRRSATAQMRTLAANADAAGDLSGRDALSAFAEPVEEEIRGPARLAP